MKVRAAIRGARDLSDCVFRIENLWVGNALYSDIAFSVPTQRFHTLSPDLFSLRIFLTSNGGPGMHFGVRPSQSVNRPDNFVHCRSSAAGLPVDSRNFAGLHQFFEAPQIFADLLLRFLAKQFRQLRPYASRWRVIDKLYPHL